MEKFQNEHKNYLFYWTNGTSKHLTKGAREKKGKSLVFGQTPLGPVFWLKLASLMAKTKFTLGPISKTNKFPL